MEALRKLRAAPGLDLVDVPPPSLGPRDVLVRVSYAGICGTDRHIYEWDAWAASRVPLDITLGHEFVGQVVEVGGGVRRVKPGDRVTAEAHIGCGSCQPCRTGNAHICERVDILGIDVDGGFASFARVAEDNAWIVSDLVPDRVAAILDPFGNAVHTVMAAGVGGRSVLVTGCGVIGLLTISVARAVGAGTIIATDVHDGRLALARDFGADHTFRSDDREWPSLVRGLTGDQGPEVLLELSGNPQALVDGLGALRNGGTAALLGLPPEPVSIDLPNLVIFKGVTILGINGRRMFETWYQIEELIARGSVPVEAVVSHTLPVQEYRRAFELIASGEALKVILEIG